MDESRIKIKQLVKFKKPSILDLLNDPRPALWKISIDPYDGQVGTVVRIISAGSSPDFVWCGVKFDDGFEATVYPEWIESTSGDTPTNSKLTIDKVNELLYDVQRCVGQERRRALVDKFVKEVG